MRVSVQINVIYWDVPAWRERQLPVSANKIDIEVKNDSSPAITEGVIRHLENTFYEPVKAVTFTRFPQGK